MRNPLPGIAHHFTSIPSVTKLGKAEALLMLFDPEFYRESAQEVMGKRRKPGESFHSGSEMRFDVRGARQSAQRERRAQERDTRRAEQKAAQKDLHEAWRDLAKSQKELTAELRAHRPTGKGGGE